ncbi:class I glutamine amidotransferase-like protein [Polyporus arcularius HHB13444]|uniref:Class I glutamine amidotransferase-like protein n=1 Tax=Polyporus arcularius HHB13444 TaxID=1314778 RepID=A0A5C3NUQ8_9APHY|nr:class I glutamine amidotransferase-like protein [Polyporus arcularius HHB13444]
MPAPSKAGILLFPGFEPLDVFGPVEALQMLSHAVKFDLVWIGPTLDPVSTAPKDLMANDPTFKNQGSSIDTRVVPTHTYDSPPDDLEVLLVPGGLGTREHWPSSAPAVTFIEKTYPKLKYLITVCTGAGLAARAGVLDGKRATTNKFVWKETTSWRPQVKWVKLARYVVDGNCWTAAGVSAGIDVTLAWIAHVYGEKVARTAANHMEYEWRDDRNWDPFAYVFSEGM